MENRITRRFIQILPADNVLAIFKRTDIENVRPSFEKILYWGLLDDSANHNKKLVGGLGNTNMVGIILSETGEPYCVEDYPIFIGYIDSSLVAGKQPAELKKIAEDIIALRKR